MTAYTIVAVAENPKTWQSKYQGAMLGYKVTLRNERGQEKPGIELSRPSGSPAPEPGETLELEIEQTDFGLRAKEPKGKGGKGGGGWKDSPETRRSIAMQHAQKAAVEITRIELDKGVWEPETADAVIVSVLHLSQRLYEQVQNAEKGQ